MDSSPEDPATVRAITWLDTPGVADFAVDGNRLFLPASVLPSMILEGPARLGFRVAGNRAVVMSGQASGDGSLDDSRPVC